MPTPVFETDRLIVRMYEPDDVAFVFDMYSRWEVQRFLGAAPRPHQAREESMAAIQRWRSFSDSNPLFGVWAVALRNGPLVGTVLLKPAPLSSDQRPMPLSDDYEVGWHLHPDHWGHGYATEMAAGALQRGYDAGIAEIIAIVVPENLKSKRVAERIGMEPRGLTNRYYSIDADLYVRRRPQ